jgi:transposase-like protein
MNFKEFQKKFKTKKSIIDHFVAIRYKNGVKCSHCGCVGEGIYHRKDNLKLFECANCGNSFSIFKDTIFEKSSTDLKKWFYAIHLFLNGKKGISALQLQREIGTTYKTAWRMLKQIRAAMGNKKKDDDDDNDDNGFMNTIIEIDETYLGGEAKNKHMSERVRAKGFFKKNIVLGILERNKEVRAFVIDEAKRDVIMEKIIENVAKDSQIITDEHKAYYWVYTGWKHKVVNHSKGKFRNGAGVHTNSIEGFWSTLKRGVYGVYHHVSKKHLQGYVNEFAFRYNNRENASVFDLVLRQAIL